MDSIQHTDVVVLGGGAAGIAAAIAASRKGSKVTLIERNAFLGGKATAAEVGTVCGLYTFSKSEKTEYLVKGFAKEFADTLQKASDTMPLYNTDGLHYLPYDITVFKNICLSLLEQYQVTVHLNATLNNISIEDELIKSAFITKGDTRIKIHLSSFIDCSGDSIISQAANLPLIQSDQYQAAAQVFTMQGVEEENESRLGLILMRSLRSAIAENKLADYYDRVYIVQGSLKKKSVSLKVGIPIPVTHLPGNSHELEKSARNFVNTLADFLIHHIPVFKNAIIEHMAPETGVRVGLRTMGKYILTEEDVLDCKKFDDAIANASWPIEEWKQHYRVSMRYLKPGDHYQVPARCLQSKFIRNLFMAGRNISASDGAIASARVMGICLQTGYAAGIFAESFIAGLPESIVLKSIQNEQL